ncbi:MAG: hypothetical protein EPO32_02785 [Anaerolineae bacterium]|nr:MAG: hypothetical protein EPO32_02785 [Anaerolineae bacterium]
MPKDPMTQPTQEKVTQANIHQVRDADLRGLMAISLQIYMTRFPLIAGVAVLINLPVNIYFTLYGPPQPQSLSESLAVYPYIVTASLFTLLAALAIAYVVELTIYAERPTMNEAINHALVHWLPAIGTFLLTLAVIFTGSLLFILPGLALSIYLFFDMYVVSLRDLALAPALRYSLRLVQGHWWQTVGRVLFVLFLVITPTLYIDFSMGVAGNRIGQPAAILYGTLQDVIYAFALVAFTLLFLNLDYRKHDRLLEEANGTAGA